MSGGAATAVVCATTGGLQLVGEATTKHTAPGNDLKLDAGTAFDITAKRLQMNYITRRDSTKARGVKDDTPDPVVSNFRGTFRMRDGAIHFSNVTFAMPGARVSVSGRFVMESEALDFRGTVRLDAKLSQLTTGVKSFFLRVVDGLFRR